MDWTQFQSLGWGTAVAVVVIVAALAIVRRWRETDKLNEERNDLKAKYRKAVDCGDLELAGAIAGRLRDIEAKTGK